MSIELANSPVTTLNGAINNSTTSVVVVDASAFPASGDFYVIVGQEIMLCTSRSSNTLTVVRGQEGTTAVSHLSADPIAVVLTAQTLRLLFQDYNLTGDFASRPAAGLAGRIYIPTDVPWVSQYRDNGSSWDAFYRGLKLSLPPSSGWSWFNQGAATLTVDRESLLLESNDAASSFGGRRGRLRSLPATPLTITFGVYVTNINDQFLSLLARDSAGGNNHSFNVFISSGAPSLNVQQAVAVDTFNAVLKAFPNPWPDIVFLRYSDDGTNKTWLISQDGIYFQIVHTVAHTSWITADQIGFAAAISSAPCRLVHYEEI